MLVNGSYTYEVYDTLNQMLINGRFILGLEPNKVRVEA